MSPAKVSKGLSAELYEFFSSVKLALLIFIVLAVTSIIGTVVPQGESIAFYAFKYCSKDLRNQK
jgi:cytochrome c biogenesis protein